MSEQQTLLDEAAALGYGVVTDPATPVDPAAARLLPEDAPGLAIAVAGDVLYVVTDGIPSPADFTALERASGMLVTVGVAPADVFAALTARRNQSGGADVAPRNIGPALATAVERHASDVHLTVGIPPHLRIAGELVVLERWPALSAADLEAAARWVAGDKLNSFTGDFDCAISYAGARWRVSLYRQRGGLALALRRIPTDIPRLDKLSLPSSVAGLSTLTNGLVLFAGPTGSGKSTTMAALIDRINRERACHILTIEDPVEFSHGNHRSIVHQRGVGDGEDTADFPTALRHALRQDPDVILLGEMRDPETMRVAMAAAETGHLVLATVHARNSAGVFDRIIDQFPPTQQSQIRSQLAATLRAVVSQRLLPASAPGQRQLVAEVLLVTPAVRNLVRESRLQELATVLDSSAGQGMTSFDRSLAQYVAVGRILEEEARRYVDDEKSFDEQLARIPRHGATLQRLSSLDELDGFDEYGPGPL